MAGAFTFNTKDFADYGLLVEAPFVPPMATADKDAIIAVPGALWDSPALPAPVKVQFNCRIEGADAAALAVNLWDVLNALKLAHGTWATLYYFYSDRHWLARWDTEELQLQIINPCVVKTTITFNAQATMIAETPITQNANITTNPQSVNVTASGAVAGTGYTYPLVTLRNTDADPIAVETLEFENVTTGATVAYAGSLAAGSYIRLDCAHRVAETSPDNSTWADHSDLIVADDKWLALLGGEQNEITITGCDTGTLTLVYTPNA
jgi:hypothetical protein